MVGTKVRTPMHINVHIEAYECVCTQPKKTFHQEGVSVSENMAGVIFVHIIDSFLQHIYVHVELTVHCDQLRGSDKSPLTKAMCLR